MKHNFIVGLIVAFVLSFSFVLAIDSVDEGVVPGQDFLSGRAFVIFEDSAKVKSVDDANLVLSSFGKNLVVEGPLTSKMADSPLWRTYVVSFDEKIDTLAVIGDLNKVEGVEVAHPWFVYKPLLIPDDEFYYQQWGLNQTSDVDIDAPEAWDLETGSSDVVIAVIDTGIGPWSGYDTPGWSVHEDLKNKLWVNPVEDLNQNGVPDFYPSSQGGDMDGVGHNYCCRWAGGAPACYIPAHYCKDDLIGYDFYSNDNDPHSGMDSYPDEGAWTIGGSHGTPVTGVIGAETNNLVGVASLCQNCKLMILKAGNGDSIWMWPIALRYAIDHDADVISMSWGGGDDLTLHNLLIEAYNEGIVLVAAAGNSNSGVPVYPAAYPEVIGVASHKEDGVKSTLSNYGSWVDVAAPGDNVYTTKLGGGYGWSGGTSLSAPFVSSLAGLLLSSYPDFSPAQVEQVIQDSSEDKAYWQGTWSLEAGRINAFNALNEFCVFNNVSLVWNNTCVAPKPKRCVNHQVVNSCQVCGCPIASAGRHYECQGDGSCRLIGRKIKATAIEPPMG